MSAKIVEFEPFSAAFLAAWKAKDRYFSALFLQPAS
jgi:hypothetical protein